MPPELMPAEPDPALPGMELDGIPFMPIAGAIGMNGLPMPGGVWDMDMPAGIIIPPRHAPHTARRGCPG